MKTIISFLIRFVPRKYLQRFSGIGFKIVGFFNQGNNVECPICEKQYKKFLPYGRINPRANALCPNCLSLERHRLIWLFLQSKTEFFDKKLSVLHIAPEPCFLKRFEKQHGDLYITADLESPLAKVKMDIHTMPFEGNQFDVVLCNHVLEHVTDDIKAMSEINRVLKQGGWAILQVPFFSPVPEKTFEDGTITSAKEREKVFGQADHVRKFGLDYADRIQQSGLQSEKNTFGKSFSVEHANRYGIEPNEVIYLGIKKVAL
ncbi:MAG: methyltransferase domain-containing protein [Cyclobacteriaceae bacterium]